jgi:hypothetical protein
VLTFCYVSLQPVVGWCSVQDEQLALVCTPGLWQHMNLVCAYPPCCHSVDCTKGTGLWMGELRNGRLRCVQFGGGWRSGSGVQRPVLLGGLWCDAQPPVCGCAPSAHVCSAWPVLHSAACTVGVGAVLCGELWHSVWGSLRRQQHIGGSPRGGTGIRDEGPGLAPETQPPGGPASYHGKAVQTRVTSLHQPVHMHCPSFRVRMCGVGHGQLYKCRWLYRWRAQQAGLLLLTAGALLAMPPCLVAGWVCTALRTACGVSDGWHRDRPG